MNSKPGLFRSGQGVAMALLLCGLIVIALVLVVKAVRGQEMPPKGHLWYNAYMVYFYEYDTSNTEALLIWSQWRDKFYSEVMDSIWAPQPERDTVNCFWAITAMMSTTGEIIGRDSTWVCDSFPAQAPIPDRTWPTSHAELVDEYINYVWSPDTLSESKYPILSFEEWKVKFRQRDTPQPLKTNTRYRMIWHEFVPLTVKRIERIKPSGYYEYAPQKGDSSYGRQYEFLPPDTIWIIDTVGFRPTEIEYREVE